MTHPSEEKLEDFKKQWADTFKYCLSDVSKVVEVLASYSSLNEKIAAALGATPDQIQINDVAVNPASKRVYISVTRGRGAEAVPVIMRTDGSGKLSELSLDNIKHAKVAIPNATPARVASCRCGSGA